MKYEETDGVPYLWKWRSGSKFYQLPEHTERARASVRCVRPQIADDLRLSPPAISVRSAFQITVTLPLHHPWVYNLTTQPFVIVHEVLPIFWQTSSSISKLGSAFAVFDSTVHRLIKRREKKRPELL